MMKFKKNLISAPYVTKEFLYFNLKKKH